MDKRRWVLVESGKHFYLAPLHEERINASNDLAEPHKERATKTECDDFVEAFVGNTSVGSINNQFQSARS
eukprot:5883399-Pleurochrysis_carterae.AAC.1